MESSIEINLMINVAQKLKIKASIESVELRKFFRSKPRSEGAAIIHFS